MNRPLSVSPPWGGEEEKSEKRKDKSEIKSKS